MTLVTPKAAAKCKLMFNKYASEAFFEQMLKHLSYSMLINFVVLVPMDLVILRCEFVENQTHIRASKCDQIHWKCSNEFGNT